MIVCQKAHCTRVDPKKFLKWEKYYLFGKGGGEELAKEYKLELFSQIPLTEKKDSSILYEMDDYKIIFDDLSKKVVAQMDLIRKKINQVIPQQKAWREFLSCY